MKHLSHFLPMVENQSIDLKTFKKELDKALHYAKEDMREVLLTWNGQFDIIAYPSGNFQIVPLTSFKLYTLTGPDHCSELI